MDGVLTNARQSGIGRKHDDLGHVTALYTETPMPRAASSGLLLPQSYRNVSRTFGRMSEVDKPSRSGKNDQSCSVTEVPRDRHTRSIASPTLLFGVDAPAVMPRVRGPALSQPLERDSSFDPTG